MLNNMCKIVKAPAKINLYLKVNGIRADGYHDLSMIMQPISLYDTLKIKVYNSNSKFLVNKSNNLKVLLKCNRSFIPTDDKNLIVKVINYIFEIYDIDDYIEVYLDKLIPTCGGLGGGSSDAASILLFLNRYYNLNLSVDEMSRIASKFGSDIPFFIHKKECICEGRGEIITELNGFNDYYILLVNPNIRVSTKDIFDKIDNYNVTNKENVTNKSLKDCIKSINDKDLFCLSKCISNDLENVTEKLYPCIKSIKKRLIDLGALNAMMSGSGPTVFGIFKSFFKAIKCKNAIKSENKDAFVYVCKPL